MQAGGNLQEESKEVILNENGKEEIQIAIAVYGLEMQKLVGDYNAQSDRYEVVVRTVENSTANDFRNQIQLVWSAVYFYDWNHGNIRRLGGKAGRVDKGLLHAVDGKHGSTVFLRSTRWMDNGNVRTICDEYAWRRNGRSATFCG